MGSDMSQRLRTFLGPKSKREALLQIEAEIAERLERYPDVESEASLQGRLVSESALIDQRAPSDDKYDVTKRLSGLMAGPQE